jgi:hypothetical protein
MAYMLCFEFCVDKQKAWRGTEGDHKETMEIRSLSKEIRSISKEIRSISKEIRSQLKEIMEGEPNDIIIDSKEILMKPRSYILNESNLMRICLMEIDSKVIHR